MSTYRIIYRKQDLGRRLTQLYRQEQLSIGLIDISTKEDLRSSLDWYIKNMDVPVNVILTESRLEEDPIYKDYPDATFIVFKNPVTTGEYINALANECYSTYFLALRTDMQLIAFDGRALMNIMEEREHPVVVCPIMLSSDGEVSPIIRVPRINGREVDPLPFMPNLEGSDRELTLYPVMEIGLYDRALFQRLKSYDILISGDYYQAMDFGVRCFLFGYSIVVSKAFAVLFPEKLSIIEDKSECMGMNRFYTKALSVKRIAGKNTATKWKPYFDKEAFVEEVKNKQINLQKTDFFTLCQEWKVEDNS